jgi:hypothetical protein
MPRGRPLGSKNRTPRAPRADADRGLLDGVRGLVERNAELEAENRRLRQLLDEISRSLKVQPAAPAATATRRGRRAQVASVTEGETPRRRGRPRKSAAPARVRRKITDPEVLEKRRSALAKARAVRAERLAAARG